MARFKALIIGEAEWELMIALDPHFDELSYEENEGRYLVLNYTSEHTEEPVRWMIVTPETFASMFHVMTNHDPIKTYYFVE